MTKEEKQALDANTKEAKAVNVRLDRLIRQIEISNIIEIKKNGFDIEEIIRDNDIFEDFLKKHAIDVLAKKLNKKEDKDNA